MNEDLQIYDLSDSTIKCSQSQSNIFQSIEFILQPTVIQFVEMINQFINSSAKQILKQDQIIFSQRQLFILFEKELNCDPETDHLIPKDVFPLFQQQLSHVLNAQQKILTDEISKQTKNLIHTIEKKISNNFGDIIQMADQFGLALALASQESVDMQKIMLKLQKISVDEKIRLRKDVLSLREQLITKKRMTMLFKMDFEDNHLFKKSANTKDSSQLDDITDELQNRIQQYKLLEDKYQKELRLKQSTQLQTLQLQQNILEKDSQIESLENDLQSYKNSYDNLLLDQRSNDLEMKEQLFQTEIQQIHKNQPDLFDDGLTNESETTDQDSVFRREFINNYIQEQNIKNKTQELKSSEQVDLMQKLEGLQDNQKIEVLMNYIKEMNTHSSLNSDTQFQGNINIPNMINRENSAIETNQILNQNTANQVQKSDQKISKITNCKQKSNYQQDILLIKNTNQDDQLQMYQQLVQDKQDLDVTNYALQQAKIALMSSNVSIQVTNGIDQHFSSEILGSDNQNIVKLINPSNNHLYNSTIEQQQQLKIQVIDDQVFINGIKVQLTKNKEGQFVDKNGNIISMDQWFLKNNTLIDLYGCKITEKGVIHNQWKEEIQDYQKFLTKRQQQQNSSHQGIIAGQNIVNNIFDQFGIQIQSINDPHIYFQNIFDHIEKMLQRRQSTIDKWLSYELKKTNRTIQGNARHFQNLQRNKFNLGLINQDPEAQFKWMNRQKLKSDFEKQSEVNQIQISQTQEQKVTFRKKQSEIMTVKCQQVIQPTKRVVLEFGSTNTQSQNTFRAKNLLKIYK